jgi:hypothetical protein
MSVIETTATEAVTEQLAEALAPQPEAPSPPSSSTTRPPSSPRRTPSGSSPNGSPGPRWSRRPAQGRPEAVFATVMYGREIGLGPMQSLQSIHFIKGKPAQSADLMRATIRRHGHIFQPKESTNERCVIYGHAPTRARSGP